MKRFFEQTQPTQEEFPFKIQGKQRAVARTKPARDFPFALDVAHKEIVKPVPLSERVTPEDILNRLQITSEESARIANIPQGTQAWLDARKNRLTASNFGAAVGMNKYKSAKGLLKDMLWTTFKGNQATRWGSEHEDVARDAYIAQVRDEIAAGTSPYTSIRVEETGLYVNPLRPWLGSSPDGIVHVTTKDGGKHKFLLEIKCPFRKAFYEPAVPTYYACQIQGVMANMDLPHCDFVVWHPGGMQITRVPFDPEFWETTLYPGLHSFYHKMYLPAIVAKQNGILLPGEITPILEL